MRHALLALLLFAVACDADVEIPDAGADAGPVEAPRAWLVDDEGGVLILRGTNVEGASKWAPDFLPPNYTTQEDFTRLRAELGLNAVRFLVFWEAVEPAPGEYDLAYLAAVRARVEAAGAAGLHVIVDMHQDVFGRGFGGDGAPRWACDEALYASFTPPAEWFLGYFEPEVQACFDRLWLDASLRAAYAAMWAAVADALRGAEGLFAYELINEPHWGTSALRAFEGEIAPAAYAEWLDAIREVDPAPYVMMGPASAANIGLSSNLAPPDRPRTIYGPHLYPAGLERGMGWADEDDAVLALTRTIEEDATRMGRPTIVGETGARADVPGALTFLRQVYDAFDHDRLSATQWEGGAGSDAGYGVWTETGELSAVGVAIARPYPARTRGEPLAWSWDADAGRFTFTWREDGAVGGDTRVALPRVAFPDGAEVTVDDGGAATVEDDTLVIDPGVAGTRSLRIVRR